jgi:mannose-6-phosphate isomerase
MNVISVKKPWGSFTRFTHNELSTVKLLYINKGEELSLQYHTKRSEFWKILKGHPEVVVGESIVSPSEGDEFRIEPNKPHRIQAVQDEVIVLEISEGEFEEDDIVRLEDKYNRA